MASALRNMAWPGGQRRIVARWVVEGELILESSALLAGGSKDVADLTVLRDRKEGLPLLTGASLAGTLRNYLADLLGGYRLPEDAQVAALFGAQRADDKGMQSPLIVFDALGRLPQDQAIEIRDGVSIDPASGLAADHKKFDQEVLPRGTTFPIRVDLLIADQAMEGTLAAMLVEALGGLAPGGIGLGVRRSRGMGAVRTRAWRAERFDLSTAQGWVRWCISPHERPPGESPDVFPDVRTACRAAGFSGKTEQRRDSRERLVMTVKLRFSGGLLIRSASGSADAPDAVHLTSAGEPILPGTSLAGALRARARRILKVVRQQHGDDQRWLERLFGSEPGDRDNALSASRLRVSENVVQKAKPLRQTRVQIDRFTQGTVPGALFEEEPLFGGQVEVRIELRAPEKGEVGLLLLLLKDLLTGDLALGGTSSVGRGVASGTAEITLEDGRTLRLNPDQPSDAADAAIRELRDVPAIAARGAVS